MRPTVIVDRVYPLSVPVLYTLQLVLRVIWVIHFHGSILCWQFLRHFMYRNVHEPKTLVHVHLQGRIVSLDGTTADRISQTLTAWRLCMGTAENYEYLVHAMTTHSGRRSIIVRPTVARKPIQVNARTQPGEYPRHDHFKSGGWLRSYESLQDGMYQPVPYPLLCAVGVHNVVVLLSSSQVEVRCVYGLRFLHIILALKVGATWI
eukprot:scaffold2697_cov392-Prasinococcus_capsulatus_cf.AAC.16